MHDRRARLLAMEFPEFKEEVLDHIEHVAGLRAEEMGEKIGAQCKESVNGVMFAINTWTTAQEKTMRDIGDNAKAAADGSAANGLALAALTKSLEGTIAVEQAAHKSVTVIGWIKNHVFSFSAWLKEALTGIAAIIFFIGLATGAIKVKNILDFFIKQ